MISGSRRVVPAAGGRRRPEERANLEGSSVSDDQRGADEPIDEPVTGSQDIEDDWDDDWDDEPAARSGGGLPIWVGIAGLVAVLVLVAVVVATRGSDDDKGTDAAGGGTETTQAGGGDAQQCADWPGIGGLGAPDIVTEPGLHMWSDLDGWHVSRVPGEGVTGVVATVQTNGASDDLPSQKSVTGGATIQADGSQLKITLPDGATASQADFDIGSYATKVTISMADPSGAMLAPDAFTTGSGDQASTNPIVGAQVMKACGT